MITQARASYGAKTHLIAIRIGEHDYVSTGGRGRRLAPETVAITLNGLDVVPAVIRPIDDDE